MIGDQDQRVVSLVIQSCFLPLITHNLIEVWRYGGMEIWRYGDMEIQGMEVWRSESSII